MRQYLYYLGVVFLCCTIAYVAEHFLIGVGLDYRYAIKWPWFICGIVQTALCVDIRDKDKE